MQNTSTLYRSIMGGHHWFETSVVIGENGRLLTHLGDVLLFGGAAILVDMGGADSGYGSTQLVSLNTTHSVFAGSPSIGNCYSGELSLSMIRPQAEIAKMARIMPFVRVTNGVEYSEWIPKGVYFIDTREITQSGDGIEILSLHAYDSMLKAEADYPSDNSQYPMTDINVVRRIANALEVGIDSRTVSDMNRRFSINLPAGYSMRETLGFIASMYAGNFVINDSGDLRLIKFNSIPAETNYLIDSGGYAITFGENSEVVRILV